VIEEFEQVVKDRHQVATEWKKKTGGKVIGVLCCSVPEEIIHAAGMLPVRIMGAEEETTEADLHFSTNVCPYCKSCFDQALKGKYDYLDGLVVPNVCNMIKSMYGFSKHLLKMPFVYFLEVPQRLSENGVEFFTAELERFARALQAFSGKPVTEQALSRSVSEYNRGRTLASQACEMRKKPEPLISGSEAQDIVLAGMLMPRQEYNRRLASLLDSIGNRQDTPPPGVRLFLSASILDNDGFLQQVEECGGMVVADDMPAGSRYFTGLVNEHDRPLHALADRYLNKVACPRKLLPEERLAFVSEMLEGADVRGALIYSMRACDPHLYEYPFLRQYMEAHNLPVLFFRGEGAGTARDQQKADIEAFIEVLKG